MKIIFIVFICLFTTGFSVGQVICIDPGHGYGPNGENLDSRTSEEITTNCAVGLLLEDTLTKLDYSVIMTRTTNDSGSWMSLTQRAELADNYDSERLLSIHCNGGGGTGTETFWCFRASPNKAIDSIFSQLVQDKMVYHGEWRNRRSTEDFPYLGFHLGVLKGSTPGCLNEIGFVDTPADLEKLLDENWRRKFAIAYSEAINESFEVDYSSSVNSEFSGIKIFPNPITHYLNIALEIRNSDYFSFQVLDITGQIVLTNNSYCVSDNPVFLIDVEDLDPGIYFIKLSTKNIRFSRMVIKTD